MLSQLIFLAEGLDVTVVVFALVVYQGVTKTPGNVRNRVLRVNLVHVARNHAARPAKGDVIKHQGFVTTVLKVGMGIFVPRSVVQAVSRDVINSMEAVYVNQGGKEIDVQVCLKCKSLIFLLVVMTLGVWYKER